MLRKLFVIVTVFIGFILQTSVFSHLRLGGVMPNLLLIITATFGFMRGRDEGMIVGAMCGILTDIFFGGIFGFYTLIYVFIGYLNGFFKYIFYPEDIKLPMILVTVSDFLYLMLTYMCLYLLRGRANLGYYFVHIILRELVYTVLITIVLYKIIVYINEFIETYEMRRA